jgi:uncharacterized protein with PIN domain
VIANSEVGYGALSVTRSVFTKACTNLATFGEGSIRKYHTGKRAELSDDVYALLTDETKAASDKAIWLQTRDVVANAFDEAKFEATAKRLGNAAQNKVEATVVPEVIERVGRKFNLNEGERKGILGALISGGDLSQYGVHSAITRFSQEDAVNYDRASELERIGGDVIDLSPSDWKEVTKVAA